MEKIHRHVPEAESLFDRLNQWMRDSLSLKLMIIGILMLLLLIPTAMIRNIIEERQLLSETTKKEVGEDWSGQQRINGPILSIPVEVTKVDKDGQSVLHQQLVHILPNTFDVKGDVETRKRSRGIYDVVVYTSDLNISGNFLIRPDVEVDAAARILWDKAFVTVGISDLRGIKDRVVVDWNGTKLDVEPGSRIPVLIPSGFTADLPQLEEDRRVPFALHLHLQGSDQLSFIPVGADSRVSLSSAWPSPSFSGKFLPDERQVTANGFEATWKVLQLNRNYPQSWTGDRYSSMLNEYWFGTTLMIPVNDYQKSLRSSKYAVMTIALTFLVCFLVEVMVGQKIHPMQYILVGLSLCLFYILLVAISEHSSFDLAYLIASVTVTAMISLYTLSVFRKRKYTVLVTSVLTFTYGFLYVILQLEDYALLMGTIGLTLILATVMYLTRNIDWYALRNKTSDLRQMG